MRLYKELYTAVCEGIASGQGITDRVLAAVKGIAKFKGRTGSSTQSCCCVCKKKFPISHYELARRKKRNRGSKIYCSRTCFGKASGG